MKTRMVFFDFLIPKMPKNTKNFYLTTEVKHDQSSYFCRGPDDFLLGPCPRGGISPWWMGRL